MSYEKAIGLTTLIACVKFGSQPACRIGEPALAQCKENVCAFGQRVIVVDLSVIKLLIDEKKLNKRKQMKIKSAEKKLAQSCNRVFANELTENSHFTNER